MFADISCCPWPVTAVRPFSDRGSARSRSSLVTALCCAVLLTLGWCSFVLWAGLNSLFIYNIDRTLAALRPTPPSPYTYVVQGIDDDFVDEQGADGENGDGGEETDVSGDSKHEQVDEHSLIRVPDSKIRKIISGRQASSKRWKKVRRLLGSSNVK